MVIVSGCPRSGTSLMMDCLRHVTAEDRILGEPFPMSPEHRIPEKDDRETETAYRLRVYAAKRFLADNAAGFGRGYEDLNPEGFWEGHFSVTGIQYRNHLAGLFRQLRNENKRFPYICKIVSQGLLNTDPGYVDAVILMVRDPGSVAKSQERLRSVTGKTLNRARDTLAGSFLSKSPAMFINVSVCAAQWFTANPGIPVHVVCFDDLILDSCETLQGVQVFLDSVSSLTGHDIRLGSASGRVKPSLRRSVPEDTEGTIWEEAYNVYSLLIKKDFKGILDYATDPLRQFSLMNRSWMCYRRGTYTDYTACLDCCSNAELREHYKALDARESWKKEPCMFECGMNPFQDNPISIEESICNNFWSK